MKLIVRFCALLTIIGISANLMADEAPRIGMPTVTSLTPLEMTDWGTPKALLPGANDYVLQGNPGVEGIYTVRLKLPANYQIPPYYQTSTTYMTVISGEYHIGVGDTFDITKGKDLPPGSFITIPPNVHVYAWTTANTIVQIHGLGPWGVRYVTKPPGPLIQQQSS